MRGATTQRSSMALPILYFNPRAPCGARPASPPFCGHEWPFQSTRPMRGATQILRCDMAGKVFQSTRPMRGATTPSVSPVIVPLISIHAPHAGRDRIPIMILSSRLLFQSTRPMRGATKLLPNFQRQRLISIHAPHAGRDRHGSHGNDNARYFNPRAPCGARLDAPQVEAPVVQISIHAPHAGRDRCNPGGITTVHNFNPRAPCGARHGRYCSYPHESKFQSTRPMRGATGLIYSNMGIGYISIHAPHAGRDECR